MLLLVSTPLLCVSLLISLCPSLGPPTTGSRRQSSVVVGRPPSLAIFLEQQFAALSSVTWPSGRLQPLP